MKYLDKAIATQFGPDGSFWVITGLTVSLYSRSRGTAAPQPGVLEVTGWSSKAAHDAGKEPMDVQRFPVDDASALTSYPALVTELVTLMVGTPSSQFYGAAVGDFTYPV